MHEAEDITNYCHLAQLCYVFGMCSIKGCCGQSVAHGLCQKHYMRLRRCGDPNRVGKRGPKRPQWQQGFRAMFPNYSPRTQARQITAFKLLSALGSEAHNPAVAQATRPNGSLNVSKLLNIAIMMRTFVDEEN